MFKCNGNEGPVVQDLLCSCKLKTLSVVRTAPNFYDAFSDHFAGSGPLNFYININSQFLRSYRQMLFGLLVYLCFVC